MINIKWLLSAIVCTFALFNFISLSLLRLETDGDLIKLRNIFGKKDISFSSLEDISVIVLKLRAVLVLSNEEKFVFIPSHFQNFIEFVDELQGNVGESVKANLMKIDKSSLAKKRIAFFALLTVLSVFLVGSGIYNIINN